MNIIFITVSYNNFRSTKEYIESFLALSGSDKCSLIVVDNSLKADTDLSMYIDSIPNNIIYIRQRENKGYMSACNFGYSSVKNNFPLEHVVIYSNNDILFHTKEMINIIRDNFVKNTNLGVLSPNVIDKNTSNYLNPFLICRPSSKTIRYLRLLYSNYWLCKIFHSIKKQSKRNPLTPVSKMYATHGCMFIMSSKLLEDFPDDGYFLYAEEITIAESCREKNLETIFDISINIEHVSHATTGSTFGCSQFNFKRNAINYIKRKYVW